MLALINDGILDPGDKVLTFDYMVSVLEWRAVHSTTTISYSHCFYELIDEVGANG